MSFTVTEEDGYVHRWCRDCDDLDYGEEFDCFDDGCEYECCGCGACCAPELCSATGRYSWHE